MKGLPIAAAVLLLVAAGCGDFLPLDEDPSPNVRIARFDPSPLAPKYEIGWGVLVPSSEVYVENYSQVPVTFDRFDIRYYEATPNAQGNFSELLDLRSSGQTVIYCPGVVLPYRYVPDSTSVRSVKTVTVGQLQIYTAAAYMEASRGTVWDYSDDLPIFAVVKLTGQTDSGVHAEVEAAVPITALVQK